MTQDSGGGLPLDDHNKWADHWRNQVGVNVIPADTKNKTTRIQWGEWQDKPIPESQHEKWKSNNAFSSGIAVIAGKVWHKQDKEGYYLTALDADKIEAIKEICNRNGKTTSLQEMAQKTLVEQHKDCLDRAHFYFYSPIPFPQKTPDSVLGLEVKGSGDHGLMFCSPSIHKNGYPYEIIGKTEPATLNTLQAREFIQHINQICMKYGLEYLSKSTIIDERLKTIIKSLKLKKEDSSIRIPKGTRHLTLISFADSLLFNHLGKKKEQEWLRDFFFQINNTLCEPEPLSEQEMEQIWNSAVDFVTRKIKLEKEEDEEKEEAATSLVEQASEDIMSKYRFLTIEERKEIWVYRDGVYVPGGEILVEKEAERMYRYHLANKHLSEIKGPETAYTVH
jgi:Bifunctional DNA primase/polymerase, N-terminal